MIIRNHHSDADTCTGLLHGYGVDVPEVAITNQYRPRNAPGFTIDNADCQNRIVDLQLHRICLAENGHVVIDMDVRGNVHRGHINPTAWLGLLTHIQFLALSLLLAPSPEEQPQFTTPSHNHRTSPAIPKVAKSSLEFTKDGSYESLTITQAAGRPNIGFNVTPGFLTLGGEQNPRDSSLQLVSCKILLQISNQAAPAQAQTNAGDDRSQGGNGERPDDGGDDEEEESDDGGDEEAQESNGHAASFRF
ncbi:hypothetical protein MKZ38_009095 [Zalerion maritima]|uniref:Uncharacterized protein n=1 Tax=Zalerion maritima TaxID=339359 RepID=A0AAD5RTL0_9PEZI|nr:hypothetical protein MKZ38_009095 [Zalerion maritima]